MKRNGILKGAGVLLIAAVMVLSTTTVTANTTETKAFDIENSKINTPSGRDVLFEDGYETYEDFVIEFPPWTLIDGDGANTYGHSGCSWPNQWDPQAFIIFNPSQTNPPLTDPNGQPHSGDKYAACFNSELPATNDDWMITPQLGPGDFDEVSLWAKAFSNQYQIDRFEVGVSTTDTNPENFTIISDPPYVEPPWDAWEQYIYDLDDYDGQSIYIGIHCVSYDAWFLMIDDFSVTGALGPIVDANGPYEGVTGEGIQFTGSATGGTPPYTWHWDFGNGDTLDEQNPVYAYSEAGVYTVTLTVTDDIGLEGEDTTTATITGPILEIDTIKGGLFKVSAEVKNTGEVDATGVNWSITLDGGAFIGKVSKGSGLDIPEGESKKINSKFILGFGPTKVTVKAWIPDGPSDTRSQSGFVLLFFINVKPGGGI